MCLLIVLAGVVEGVPLVVAGNRDERFDRPAEPMAVLRASAPRILGGRDLVAGGTWLAVNEHGVVAGLTNRPPQTPGGADPDRRSRGELPLALTAHRTAAAGVQAFVNDHRPEDYNPAWLLVGDRDALFAVDLTGQGTATVAELGPGTHVLENRPLGAPSGKVDHVRRLVEGIGALAAGAAVKRLQAVLADHEIPDESPDAPPSDRPAELRAACVHRSNTGPGQPDYGTRWSGIVTVPDDRASRPSLVYTDGPPCTARYLDATARWG